MRVQIQPDGSYEVKHYQYSDHTDGLPSDRVMSMQDGPDGFLYVGTRNGLARFDRRTNQMTRLTDASGHNLPTGRIEKIVRDADDVLWFASDSGVHRYDGVAWTQLGEEDGLISDLINTLTLDAQGAVWIGTNDGLTRYRPVDQATPKPRLTIQTEEDYRSNEKIPPMITGQLAALRYSAIDYRTRPNKRLYRCGIWPGRLATPPVKDDEHWRPVTHSERFDWNAAGPGEYTFFVQSIDRDMNYSEPTSAFLTVFVPW